MGPSLLGAALAASAAAPAGEAASEEALRKRVERILARTPLVDGHNDVPWQVRERAALDVEAFDFAGDLSRGTGPGHEDPMFTDLPRLREGRWGGVFWSVWVPVDRPPGDTVVLLLEQIDVVHRLCAKYPSDLACVTDADGLEAAHRAGRIGSLVGIEGGHSIGGSLGVLRVAYGAGARYLTLTHWKTTDWADSATDDPRHGGLAPFGETVVRELNRLGMLVDLSHVSAETMRDALAVTTAPVIFSHSGAFSVNPHPRNVPDDVLDLLKANGGVVMVDFLPSYVSAEVRARGVARKAEGARLDAVHVGDPAGRKAAMEAWDAANPEPPASLAQVADHLDHVRARIGAAHVGIGTDFDGMDAAPAGLDDVSKVPALLVELLRRGWTDDEVAGVAGGNVLRALRAAEARARALSGAPPASVPRPEPDAHE